MCEAVRCPALVDPTNGRMNCSGGSFGSSCSFSCNDGFHLQGAPEITCTESAEWSQEKPYCGVVQCSDLTEPLHGSMQCEHLVGHFSYQSSCEFSCEEGYTLTGSNSSRLMCEASGHWNGFEPTCEVVQCSDLTEPLHGSMQCQNPLESFGYESSCEFSCEDGYTLTGSSSGQLSIIPVPQLFDAQLLRTLRMAESVAEVIATAAGAASAVMMGSNFRGHQTLPAQSLQSGMRRNLTAKVRKQNLMFSKLYLIF
uniref:Sushi domain-containing protein n=1 Tax=Pygocentrus nattereri TaxID=42514 RepID=A0A3B4D9R9_PYGNA